MLLAEVALLMMPQSLTPIPSVVEDGAPVRVVVRDAVGVGIPAVEVSATTPAGGEVAVGVTGPDGTVTWVPSGAGRHALAAGIGGVRLRAPLLVVAPPPRVPLGVVGGLAGAALLWLHLRGMRPRRAAARLR